MISCILVRGRDGFYETTRMCRQVCRNVDLCVACIATFFLIRKICIIAVVFFFVTVKSTEYFYLGYVFVDKKINYCMLVVRGWVLKQNLFWLSG